MVWYGLFISMKISSIELAVLKGGKVLLFMVHIGQMIMQSLLKIKQSTHIFK